MFETFFALGWRHLTEPGAWDHQLFLLTVALAYQPTLWRRWVSLATVFAVGHTAAVGLVMLDAVALRAAWIEPAIAGSIVTLALVDLGFLVADPYHLRLRRLQFAVTVTLVALFGVVHGLGFAAAAVGVLFGEDSTSAIIGSLAAFTLGVEAAQLAMLAAAWLVLYVILEMLQWRPLLLRRLALLGVAAAGLAVLLG